MTRLQGVIAMSKTMTESKYCPRCEKEKPISEYYSEGKRTYCRECDSTLARWRMGSMENKIRTAYRDAKKAAAKYGVYDDLTLDDVMYTFAIAGGRCAYCDKLVGRELQLEHVFALSSGGHNTVANLTTSCPTCNSRKSDEAILNHIQTNKFDIEQLNALVDRMAYRMGVHRAEVVDLLNMQQRDYGKRWAEQMIKKIKKRSE